MGLFTDSPETVHISLPDAVNLSYAARSFGASRRREADHRERPFVGSDPDYYVRQAGRVFRRAVKSDPELKRLYLHGWSLSHDLAEGMYSKRIGGPSLEHAETVTGIVAEIQARLADKELSVGLSGRWLDRARNVSAFALSWMQSPLVLGAVESAAARGKEYGALYPGLSPETTVNQVAYWQSLHERLTAPVVVS